MRCLFLCLLFSFAVSIAHAQSGGPYQSVVVSSEAGQDLDCPACDALSLAADYEDRASRTLSYRMFGVLLGGGFGTLILTGREVENPTPGLVAYGAGGLTWLVGGFVQAGYMRKQAVQLHRAASLMRKAETENSE